MCAHSARKLYSAGIILDLVFLGEMVGQVANVPVVEPLVADEAGVALESSRWARDTG